MSDITPAVRIFAHEALPCIEQMRGTLAELTVEAGAFQPDLERIARLLGELDELRQQMFHGLPDLYDRSVIASR